MAETPKPFWLDRIPVLTLVIVAGFIGLAPIVPEPHLVEKARWLMTGQPFRPIDVFDVFWHSWPLGLLAWKLVRMSRSRAA